MFQLASTIPDKEILLKFTPKLSASGLIKYGMVVRKRLFTTISFYLIFKSNRIHLTKIPDMTGLEKHQAVSACMYLIKAG